MNLEQQRIAIAEACGWKETEAWLDGRRCFERADSNAGWDFDSLPDFLNDLNAMHEAEKVLPDLASDGGEADQLGYCEWLAAVCSASWTGKNSADMWLLAHATASQRAEAFLRTIGKWKEAKP